MTLDFHKQIKNSHGDINLALQSKLRTRIIFLQIAHIAFKYNSFIYSFKKCAFSYLLLAKYCAGSRT